MTGTGIKTDPYIITTVDELYEMDTLGGYNVYFKLGADLDYNGTEYNKNYVRIPFKFAELDGDGHSIKNIHIENPDAYAVVANLYNESYAPSTQVMKNVNFENTIVSGKYVHFFAGPADTTSLNITNCKFSVTFRPGGNQTNGNSGNSSFMSTGCRYLYFDLCTFAITMDLMNAYPLLCNGSFKRGQIDVNIRYLHGNDYSTQNDGLFYFETVTDSYIFGNVAQLGEPIEGKNNFYFSIYGTHKEFYQVIRYTNISDVYWNSSIMSPCFYDKDVAGNINMGTYSSNPNPGWIYSLSTEQCKDAAYLRSLGYLVEGD